MVNFEINSTFIDLIYLVINVHKNLFLNAAFFLCHLERCEILDNSSQLFRSANSGGTALTSVFGNLRLSPSGRESFRCEQIGDSGIA
jgi:hypothetical protein